MEIGKRYTFEAAHKLVGHKGKCSRLHGHSYKIEVKLISLKGSLQDGVEFPSSKGMVVDFSVLDEAMGPIIQALDHDYLNDVMDTRTTAENVVAWILSHLERNLMQSKEGQLARVSRVRVWETEKGYAEWRRDG